jgi:DNA-binding transcriptional LysR family regulator
MPLSLESLQVLDAIDRRGSFAGAADELGRVPSAITYSIQQLEHDLDVLLFDRRGHRAKLTEAGRELLDEGRRLLQSAVDLERRVKQVARGWEAEFRISLDTLFDFNCFSDAVKEFYAQASGTRLRFSSEVLGGNWDALASNRVDLAIGASGAAPSGGFATKVIGRVEFTFVAAPGHPITLERTPIASSTILRHRAVSVGDTSRNLPPRTSGLLSGQDVLTVPDFHAKVAAHVAGLGVGYLPNHLALPEIAAGRLVGLEVEAHKPGGELMAAWRPERAGKALKWFVHRLDDFALVERLFGG